MAIMSSVLEICAGVARGEAEREELRRVVKQELDKARTSVPRASRKDIEELSQKIDELATRIDELAGKMSAKEKAG